MASGQAASGIDRDDPRIGSHLCSILEGDDDAGDDDDDDDDDDGLRRLW